MGSKLEISEVHSILLEHLDFIHSVCEAHNIKYSLYAGTLLGAIRYNGFIPWDDDADIVMSRADFEKLRTLLDDIGSIYVLERKSLWIYRLRKIHQPKESSRYGQVCTDVFIFDSVNSNAIFRWTKFVCLLLIQAMIKPIGSSFRQGFFAGLLQSIICIVGLPFNRNLKLRLYDRTSHWGYNRSEKGLIHVSNDQIRYLTNIYPDETQDNVTEHRFEGRQFYISIKWKLILTQMYGENFMIPPPADEQIPMHSLKNIS